MRRIARISCCIVVFAWYTITESTNQSGFIPKFTIDLDQPAETRWRNVARKFAAFIPTMQQILKLKIPSYVLPLAEEVALYVDTLFEEPYPMELKGLSEAVNISLSEVILTNMFYDLTAYCTSIVAQDEHGDIFHARNLDYEHKDFFQNVTIHVDFIRNGRLVYNGITFAGYIGILTGQKPFAFTLTLDERDKGYIWENIFQLLLAKTTPVGFLLRSVLANKDSDFDYAVEQISKVEMIAPAYIIVGGVKNGEGAVITRERCDALDVWKLNVSESRWFLVETNYDHWKPVPPSDDRRDPAIKAMNQMGQQRVGVKGLFNVMSTQPVLNYKTVYTCIMSAKYPSIFTAQKRRCCD